MSGRMPPGARRTVLLMAGAVGLCTLAASSSELFTVTDAAKFPLLARLAIPGGLDFGAIASGIAWAFGGRESDLQRYGRRTTKQLIVASAVFNAAAVAHRFEVLPMWAVLVLALFMGLTFPIIAGQMMHLVLSVQDAPATVRAPQPQAPSRWRRASSWVRARTRRRPRPQRAQRPAPSAPKPATQASPPSPQSPAPSSPAPQAPSPRPRPVSTGTGDPEWQRQLARVVAQKQALGSAYGRSAVREDLTVPEERAKRLLAAAKDQLAERSPA